MGRLSWFSFVAFVFVARCWSFLGVRFLFDCLRFSCRKAATGTMMVVLSHCQLLPMKLLPFCQGVPFTLIFSKLTGNPSAGRKLNDSPSCGDESPTLKFRYRSLSPVLLAMIFHLHLVSALEMIGCWDSPVIELTSKAGSEVLKTTASIRCETSTGSTFTSPASLTSLMFCFNSSIELDVDGLRTSSMSVESFHRIS